jgi:hypothetical protein
MRQFAPKVELLTPDSQHLRWINGALAQAMVEAETAAVSNMNGRVKAIRLTASVTAQAQRVGPATPLSVGSYGTRFIMREKLDSGGVVWKFHRRSFSSRG